MTHENPPLSPQPPGIPDHEQEQRPMHLSEDQLGVLIKYTEGGIDRRFESRNYVNAMNHLNAAAEQSGDNAELAGIAITAATVGAMSRDPEVFRRSGPGLVQRMEGMGVAEAHAGVFVRMQGKFRAKPDPTDIGHTLRAGLKYLDGRREDNGEDISAAKIAFLASGFAATKDVGLRRVIVKQLRAGQ